MNVITTLMKLLLVSNSTNPGENFLDFPLPYMKDFLQGIDRAVFVPYAAVTLSFNEYKKRTAARFAEIGIALESVHEFDNPAEAIYEANTIVVGGGNTFQLAKIMQELGMIEAIRERVGGGVPYIGWSAGANIACPTIGTTNDMPIFEPKSFRAAGLVPFQINPHYTDFVQEGHGGESREQRIEEYIAANPSVYVAGLREGSLLRIDDNKMQLSGSAPMRLFKYGRPPREFRPGDDVSFLLG